MKYRLAVLASHPIHYQAPLWRTLASEPDLELKVFFMSGMGVTPYHDVEFGRTIQWDVPLVSGYANKVLSGKFELIEHLRRGRYDALLVHGWNSKGIWLAVIGAKFFGVKVFLRAESPWNQETRRGARGILKRLFFGMVDAFLYIGEENRLFYERYGIPAGKMFFTPYSVENERFFEEAARTRKMREAIRSKMGLPSGAVVFLSVGKLIEKKRHMDLLRAYEECDAEKKALIIVGEGELRPNIEAYIKERDLKNVILAGFVGQTKIAPYYSAADVFVLPSGAGETWGLVVNEAMCFGLPVIASSLVGSAKDLVRPGENGFIFPLGDARELARGMSELAADADMRRAFGRRSAAIVADYSYHRDAAGILEALKSVK